MKPGQFPTMLPLASLNGLNGFKLDGEVSGDKSGISVSAAGDINGDGHADLLIGAIYHGSNTGRSYVVFGGPNVGAGGTIALSNLNGTNGFKLDGEVSGDKSGISVSAAGDINGDGHADLLIGAYFHASATGRSYVVFGGVNVSSGGTIPLSSLNGSNGFKLDGELTGDQSGISVSAAGDINGDGYADLVIGAFGYPSATYTGRSYVVFGGSNVGSGGTILLSSLNGINGIKFNGEGSGDYSGHSVSAAGDINGDGRADLLIASPYHASQTGRSYVVFGGSNVGNGGMVLLANLNGTNGFKLNGEASGDYSGYPVSAAGDINGDGHADLLIGSQGHANFTGRSYVVFGGLTVGVGGTILLSSLNGTNGFKLDGEASGDGSGYSVSAAGDLNGDGRADLLIASPSHANQTGRSYVVFGGSNVGIGGTVLLSSLNGVNGFKLDGEASGDYSGRFVSAVGDINGDGVVDILIGAPYHSSSIGRSYVIFGDIPPVLVNNSLSLSVGAAIQLNSTYLAAYDRNHNNNTLVFIPTAISHGYFTTISAPNIPLVNFTQQQVVSGSIQFIHDGTLVAPSYNITVRSTGIAWTGPLAAKINFIGTPQSHFPAIIPLASLNGQNGFKLDGEVSGDDSGSWVSTAGDINDDGYADLLIGAYYHTSGAGRSYVVFGGAGVVSSEIFNLASLNGTNGFKLDGENANDHSGYPVSTVGDINGDGHTDLIIGANTYPGNLNKGRSYVVFGGRGVGSGGSIALSNLTGVNGFKLDGEANGDYSGWSVSAAGDINDDGHADLIIGAEGYPGGSFKGRSYVVYGGTGVGSSGSIALSSLTGINGFKFDGEADGDRSGSWVSAEGDINGDGYIDLLIGAYGHASNVGRSYVIFGGLNMGNGSTIPLSSLNGVNGFKLDGEVSNDYSGFSVSTAGDINGDGYADLLIGAHGYASNTGRSYVVFGGHNVGNVGTILLSNLNGTKGFTLDGEASGDYSGFPVSAAGDINGDGYVDLLIGAYGHASSRGRSYIVFGGPNVNEETTFLLSSLNGTNGFKLDGEAANDASGHSVNTAGDINGDGVADIVIGAYGHNNSVGRSYVVFGDIPPTLVQNCLTLHSGSKIPLNSTFLSAYDRNHNNNTLMFIPTAVFHGQFELVTQPGISLANFTQPQLINGIVQFVHDGSSIAPSYNMSVYSAGIAWTGPSAANITFLPPTSTPAITTTAMPITVTPTTTFASSTVTASPTPTPTPSLTPTPMLVPTPVLLYNQLTLSDGGTVVLSSVNLQAVETGLNASSLTFYISNVQNGYFSLLPTNASVTRFLQSYVQKAQVQFVHSGNHQAPSYSIVVSDGSQATAPSPALIDFLGAPTVTATPVTVTPGGTTTLTTSNLNVSNTGGSSSNQVVFQVSNVQQGQFILNSTGAQISNFTLSQLANHNVELTQDSSNIAPSYSIAVTGSNGLSSASIPVTAQLCNSLTSALGCAPRVVRNNLWIKQGASTPLTTQNLYATDSSGQALPGDTVFYVTNVNHGYFDVNGSSSSYFTQQQLQAGVVKFVDDGTNVAPSYQIAVQSSNLQTNSFGQVTLSLVNRPPYLAGLLSNQIAVVGQPFSLVIAPSIFVDPQGDPLILSVGLYNSTSSLPSWLNFNPGSNRFSGTPTDTGVLDIGVTASDPEGLSTVGEFSLTVLGPSATNNSSLATAIASSVVSGSIGLFFLLLKIGLQRAASKKLEAALGEGHEYEQKVVRPVAKAIAQRLKITGFMGGTTNREMLAFKDAVRTLLEVLTNHGVDLEFSKMSEIKRDNVINEVATQTKEYFLPSSRNCCTRGCLSFVSFFKAEVTPQQIRDAATAIAEAVIQAQKQHKSSAAQIIQMGVLSSSQSGVSQPVSSWKISLFHRCRENNGM